MAIPYLQNPSAVAKDIPLNPADILTDEQKAAFTAIEKERPGIVLELCSSMGDGGRLLAQAMWTHEGDTFNCSARGEKAVATLLRSIRYVIDQGKA